jgi:hypothetical protein
MDMTYGAWRKSRHSGDNGGACVEVATAWRKSTYSGDNDGSCLEIAGAPASVAVRDSKDPDGPGLVFTAGAWRAFTGRAKRA